MCVKSHKAQTNSMGATAEFTKHAILSGFAVTVWPTNRNLVELPS